MVHSAAARREAALEARKRAALERFATVKRKQAAKMQCRLARAAELSAEQTTMRQRRQTREETDQVREQMAAAVEAAQHTARTAGQ